MKVHILATCRKEELLPYTLLVFSTLRVGFPTAEVIVTGNSLEGKALLDVSVACQQNACGFRNDALTIHHQWIDYLMEAEQSPFWILDTDVIFYDSVEDWKFDTAIAGFRVPEFFDEFTNAITRSRLHTSLMYIDPVKVREQVKAYHALFPVTPFNPPINLFHPVCLPFNGRGYFHDTCSLLYHAIGCTAFTDQQKDVYYHANFGTLEDIVLPRLAYNMKPARDHILKNPELGRGRWREQMAYYDAHLPNVDGHDVIAPIKPEDSREAQAWCHELCKGDKNAMHFCNLWYGYVHGIDDLVDTTQDGRPIMSKRQMISLFFAAAILYNTTFYKQNQELLFPLILDITNAYTTSVEWEVSPEKHKRLMADLMRMSANRMYAMVALIVGGEAWMQEITQRLFDRDWTLQHDSEGNPI